jgi:uncharacterized protein YndB with AHSA1/START domain
MKSITVTTTVKGTPETVWSAYTTPGDIVKWNHASDDWECPSAQNDLRVGGTFVSRMAAKDGSAAFDFSGTYTEVEPHKLIAYTMEDGRTARVAFTSAQGAVRVDVTFDLEGEHSEELQRDGWQAILNSFKRHVEGN